MAVGTTTTKILVIGGTGYLGKFIVEASIKAGHPTFALVRESTLSNPHKSSIIHNFNKLGVNIVLDVLYAVEDGCIMVTRINRFGDEFNRHLGVRIAPQGDINDQHSLIKVIKQVDVVISTMSHTQLSGQYKILAAIKEAGNIKRFFPSEFGNDVDQNHGVDEGKVMFDTKVKFRRAIEAAGIPHTYVVANFLTQHFLPTWSQLMDTASPLDAVIVLGDGNIKSIFNTEESVAAFTIRTVDDPRTLNKTLYISPPANTLSYNDLISLWEKRTSNTLKRIYISEDQILKMMQESPHPLIKMGFAICLAAFVKGDHTNYEIDPSIGVEASKLYPDVKYTTLDEYFEKNQDRTPFYNNWLISINK